MNIGIIIPMLENQIEKNMKNEMEAATLSWFTRIQAFQKSGAPLGASKKRGTGKTCKSENSWRGTTVRIHSVVACFPEVA